MSITIIFTNGNYVADFSYQKNNKKFHGFIEFGDQITHNEDAAKFILFLRYLGSNEAIKNVLDLDKNWFINTIFPAFLHSNF